jgi:PAS domain S-box-containing protein
LAARRSRVAAAGRTKKSIASVKTGRFPESVARPASDQRANRGKIVLCQLFARAPVPALVHVSFFTQYFLFRDGSPTALLLANYQPWLVVLSLVVASLTSALGLQLAGMARTVGTGRLRQLTLLSGSLAMGGGIWAMHFIGMLAFNLCTRVTFDAGITLASMLPAVLASWVALNLLSRGTLGRSAWVLGGVLVGAGIGAMHYTGMAAMELSAELRYDPLWFGASIVVAVLLAMLALWVRFGLEHRVSKLTAVLLGGLVMGCAIAGMHYTAMGAARFVGSPDELCVDGVDRNGFMALAITVVTLTISLLTAGANGLLRYRALNRQLGREQERIQALLDTAVDGIVTIDRDGLIRSFNGAAERLFGWRADEAVGQPVGLLLPDPGGEGRDGQLRRYLSIGHGGGAEDDAGSSGDREVTARRRDGHPMPIRLAIGRVEHRGDLHYIAFITDIAERKQMEQALRDSEEQYRSLIANSPGVTFRCKIDANWSMVLVSDAMETLSGWPAADFLAGGQGTGRSGRRRQDHLPGQHEPRNPHPDERGDRLQRAAAGHLARHAAAPPHGHGAQQRAFAAGPAQQHPGHRQAGARRGGAGARDFSLRELAQQVVDSLELSAASKGLELQLDYAPALPEFFAGDALRIQQVLTNLVGNAVKFTSQGHVRLAIDGLGGKLHIAVHDTGIGIAAERLEGIFDPFAQADASMSRRFGGTGLGTTIARQLVELMGGRLWAESTLGEGSVFHVELPLVEGKPVSAEPDVVLFEMSALRILAADDVPQNIELLTLMLGATAITSPAPCNGWNGAAGLHVRTGLRRDPDGCAHARAGRPGQPPAASAPSRSSRWPPHAGHRAHGQRAARRPRGRLRRRHGRLRHQAHRPPC